MAEMYSISDNYRIMMTQRNMKSQGIVININILSTAVAFGGSFCEYYLSKLE